MEQQSMETKFQQLEHTVDLLRTEIHTKMEIMEKILNTRNEQFAVQKKLIAEEHALFEQVLGQWKQNTELVGGRATCFVNHNVQETSSTIPRFRNSNSDSNFVSTKRLGPEQRPQRKAKRLRSSCLNTGGSGRDDQASDDSLNVHIYGESTGFDVLSDEENHFGQEEGIDQKCEIEPESDDDSSTGDEETNGMEKKVFINFYSNDPHNPVESSSDPIWLHFLHEENGNTGLCKSCNDKGIQTIYRLFPPNFGLLRFHLKKKHKIVVEPPPQLPPLSEDTSLPAQSTRKGSRIGRILRHNDYLYCRKRIAHSTEYWCCREKNCTGKLVKRRGGIIESTSGHDCLTTPADCVAALFRVKVRELAETEPEMSPEDIISTAKAGVPEYCIESLPNDEAMRRCIRRIRQCMEADL